MQQLTTYLNSILDDQNLAVQLPQIIQKFKLVNFSKHQYLVTEGKICPYFCYIESGILQHAIIKNGDEKTTYLALRNTVTTALDSFKNQKPSRKHIRALSSTILWVLSFQDFKLLLSGNVAFQKFYHNLIERQIFLIDDYRIDLLTLKPEDRYEKMLQNEPLLLQKVPLKHLASFLGISTRHMSRIRKNKI